MKLQQLKLQDISSTHVKKEEKNNQLGNLSTSRGGAIKQFMTDENSDRDVFTKMQNLEFQNGLFQMQMQHIHKRKNNEDSSIRIQLSQLQKDIQCIQNKVHSSKIINDSFTSSSSSEGIPTFMNQYNNQDQILQSFKELQDVCNMHEKLSNLFTIYCGSLKNIEFDLIQKNYNIIVQQLVKMIIDIIKKFNSIKIDQLKFKQLTPDKQQYQPQQQQQYHFEFGTFNKEYKKTIRTNESPAFQSNDELEQMKFKLSDHPQFEQFEQQSSSPQINKSTQQVIKKSISTHNKQRIDIIPSLRRKPKQQNNK